MDRSSNCGSNLYYWERPTGLSSLSSQHPHKSETRLYIYIYIYIYIIKGGVKENEKRELWGYFICMFTIPYDGLYIYIYIYIYIYDRNMEKLDKSNISLRFRGVIFRSFYSLNFVIHRLFSGFFCLKSNEGKDKMVERV